MNVVTAEMFTFTITYLSQRKTRHKEARVSETKQVIIEIAEGTGQGRKNSYLTSMPIACLTGWAGETKRGRFLMQQLSATAPRGYFTLELSKEFSMGLSLLQGRDILCTSQSCSLVTRLALFSFFLLIKT